MHITRFVQQSRHSPAMNVKAVVRAGFITKGARLTRWIGTVNVGDAPFENQFFSSDPKMLTNYIADQEQVFGIVLEFSDVFDEERIFRVAEAWSKRRGKSEWKRENMLDTKTSYRI